MKRIFAVVLLISILLLAGCKDTQENKTLEIEQWEFDLICQTYNTEAEIEKLKSGELYSHQQEMLYQTRDFKKYLEEKYPGHEFTITNYEPSNGLLGNSKCYEFLADGKETVFTAIILDDDGVVFQDNYYASLFQPVYDEALKKELEKAGISVAGIYTSFPSNLGKEVNGSLTANDMFSIKSELPRTTSIYVNDTDYHTAFSQVKSTIKQLDIYGAYIVHCSELFTEGLSIEEYQEIVKINSSIMYESFQHGYGE